MSTHDIHLNDKTRTFLKHLFSSYRKNFVGTQKRIITGKRAIGVRVIEILLYLFSRAIRRISRGL